MGESYFALDGTAVKSPAERDIANFFVRHDIPSEYERWADWVDPDPADPARSYHPDFYLPQWDAYLEHWAIDLSGSGLLQQWFTGGAAKYQAEQAWKRVQFRQPVKNLWETDYVDYKVGRLEAKLAQLLVAAGAEVCPLSYDVMLENLHLKRSKTTVLHHDLAHAVVAAKTFGYSSESLLSHSSALRKRGGL